MNETQLSTGYKRCLFIIDKLKELKKEEFILKEIFDIISRYIGFSRLSKDRYLQALISFNMIKKLENGNYGFY
jgi:hypothetical protein